MKLIKETIILKSPFRDYYTGFRTASLKPGKPLKMSESIPDFDREIQRHGIKFVIRSN